MKRKAPQQDDKHHRDPAAYDEDETKVDTPRVVQAIGQADVEDTHRRFEDPEEQCVNEPQSNLEL